MQLAQITTKSLLKKQRDLLQGAFPESTWQKGTAGIIIGTELPAIFSSTEMELSHWMDNEVEVLDNEKNRIRTPADNYKFPLPILNIPTLGFFEITAILSNQSCTINVASSAYQKAINRWKGLDFEDKSITEGTGLEWSLGGFEGEISCAYETLLSDLHIAKIYPADIQDLDATYKQAIEFKALELIYESWIVTAGDIWDRKHEMKKADYTMQLQSIESTTTTSANKVWERS